MDLLGLPSATPTVISGDHAGPTYGQALGQGAVRPTWLGGTIRLTADAAEAFPEVPCCYDIRLQASTRTVVNCDGDNVYGNESDYTLGVVACDTAEAAAGGALGA